MSAMNTRQNVLLTAVFIVVVTVMLSIPLIAPGQTVTGSDGVPTIVMAGCCGMGAK
jgi:hypothetical protein